MMRGEEWLNESYEKQYKEDESKIPEDDVDYGFESPNRKKDISSESMKTSLNKINSIKFSRSFVERARAKLLLSYKEVA